MKLHFQTFDTRREAEEFAVQLPLDYSIVSLEQREYKLLLGGSVLYWELQYYYYPEVQHG